MIGTIRKHSAWLWWIIAGLTIISFVWWGASPANRNGDRRFASHGTIYGQSISQEDYVAAQREFYIYYFQHYHVFPDKNPEFTALDIERETYVRLLLKRKAEQLGIHVSAEDQAVAANYVLNSFTSMFGGRTPTMSQFVQAVLQNEGLTAEDFQRFVIDDLAIQELMQTLGLSSALIPPQQASALYDREHQEVLAQAVFFNATNYVSEIVANPAAVAQFYTNNIARSYRLPNRVQIYYLQFDLTNFLIDAEQKMGKTNLDAQAASYATLHGKEVAPDAKTPEEAKAKIRDMMLRQGAQTVAQDRARQFLKDLFAISSPAPETFVALAKTNGLTVHTTAPFSEAEGPAEFAAPADLIKMAFKLNPDSPFSIKPIVGAESVYVMALAARLPSSIEPLDQIRKQVEQDYKGYAAYLKAQEAATNFYFNAAVQMAAGKTFAQAALAAGHAPQALKPFSVSTPEIPEARDTSEERAIKVAAFTTQVGHVSTVYPTAEGAFVLYVQSMLPIDEARKKTELPTFIARSLPSRESEGFNLWLQAEATRELRNIPNYEEFLGMKKPAGRK